MSASDFHWPGLLVDNETKSIVSDKDDQDNFFVSGIAEPPNFMLKYIDYLLDRWMHLAGCTI
jgi:hypothetical protein